jgi:hypothetical protein
VVVGIRTVVGALGRHSIRTYVADEGARLQLLEEFLYARPVSALDRPLGALLVHVVHVGLLEGQGPGRLLAVALGHPDRGHCSFLSLLSRGCRKFALSRTARVAGSWRSNMQGKAPGAQVTMRREFSGASDTPPGR